MEQPPDCLSGGPSRLPHVAEKQSKLELAAAMVRQVMPSFASQKNVIILCDSWYAKKNLACIVDEYPNLDLICNARTDSVIYDLAPQPTGRRGRPAKHGERLSIKEDFTLSAEKIGDYYMGVRRVLTNIFGQREVLAYVTSTEKTGGSRRLFSVRFSRADADILRMAGKGAAKPDRE